MRDIGNEREPRRQRERGDGGVATEAAQAGEEPEERRRREEEAHPEVVRLQEEPGSGHELGRLEEDRLEVARQVEEREDAVVEEHVPLGEAPVAGVGERAPSEEVVAEVRERERSAAGHDTRERWPKRPLRPAREEKREAGHRGGHRQPGERRAADERAEDDRRPAAGRLAEGAARKSTATACAANQARPSALV